MSDPGPAGVGLHPEPALEAEREALLTEATVGAAAGAPPAGWHRPPPSRSDDRPAPVIESERRQRTIPWYALSGLALLGWAVQLAGWLTVFPWLTLLVLALGVGGLLAIIVTWSGWKSSPSTLATVGLVVLVLAIAGLAAWTFLQAYSAPGYLTDELAFDQYAAHLFIHGINPYTHSMAPSFSMFHVTPDSYTFKLNGTPVTSLSYPAMAFLVYVPLLLLGWSTQVGLVINVAAWAATIAMLHLLLPRHLRPLAIIVGSATVYVAFAVGGVTDVLFVPFLLGAAYAWDRYPFRSGWRALVSPALMGVAMGIKQQPWLIMPFLMIGLYLEARRHAAVQPALRVVLRYLGVLLVVFIVPNIPFIVMSPSAWVRGILTPFLAHTVPAGQGAISLSLFLGLGGGSLTAYTLASLVVLLALIVAYAVTYPTLKPVTFLLPVLALLFSSRSFGTYLVTLVPAAILAALTTTVFRRPKLSRRALAALVGTAMVGGIVVAVALLYPAPLSIHVTSVETTGQLATVDQIEVQVTNHSGHALAPSFSIETGTTLTSFWLQQGPQQLGPGQSAAYRLYAPNFFAQPPITGGFQVIAFTDNPATVSHAASYRPTTDHIELVPDSFEAPVPIGQPVTITAQVVDQLDRAVDRAGIPVYLGQVIYAQQGLLFSEATVNGGPPGENPVIVPTNKQGEVRFTIVGTIATADPVYFEANLVNNTNFYPFGYSSIVPIRFVSAS